MKNIRLVWCLFFSIFCIISYGCSTYRILPLQYPSPNVSPVKLYELYEGPRLESHEVAWFYYPLSNVNIIMFDHKLLNGQNPLEILTGQHYFILLHTLGKELLFNSPHSLERKPFDSFTSTEIYELMEKYTFKAEPGQKYFLKCKHDWLDDNIKIFVENTETGKSVSRKSSVGPKELMEIEYWKKILEKHPYFKN